jgi:hypothetical protein
LNYGAFSPQAGLNAGRTGNDQQQRGSSSADGGTSPATKPQTRLWLQTPQDVINLLEEQANAVRADVETSPSEKTRLILSIASMTLRALRAEEAY